MSWPRRFDLTGGPDGDLYLTRWTLVGWRGWKLRVHRFVRPDSDACFHDHPWPFWTLVLWGGYVEETPAGRVRMRPGRLAHRRSEYRHRVADLPRGVSWTLVLTGPRERAWGFWTRVGWVPWRSFLSLSWASRVPWCEEGHPTGGEGQGA